MAIESTVRAMRSKLLVLVAVLAVTFAGAARAGTTLIVTGHGWGHGVGMSQWGAYGYALHGWKYTRILSHYYPGTELKRVPEQDVRVLLKQGVAVVTVGCAAHMTVSNGHGLSWHLPAKTYGISARLAIPVKHLPQNHPFARGRAVFTCGRHTWLTLDGRQYRGSLTLDSNGSTLDVVNTLHLDQYVRGVVPSESPARWPLAELKAQAVAARSYALAELNPGAAYDLLPDTRSQVYGGVAAERDRATKAVEKTKGQVLMFGGKVARTYYSASSGGRTEAASDAWPGSDPIPYLPSVTDPYDTYSPNHDWGPFVYSASRLGALLGLGGEVEFVRVVRDSSDRAASVRARLSSGKLVVVGGTTVSRALGLKSTWFSIGALTVTTNISRALYGQTVQVVAHAVDAKPAVLQQRSPNGRWRTVQHVLDRAVFSVKPTASTAFRLRIPGASGDAVEVAVRPQLHVQALTRHRLAGTVQPRAAGPVQVWRLVRGSWTIVARPKVLQDGTFRTPLLLRPSVYRVTAGDGAFAPATKRLVITRSTLAALPR
jgi:stage II sporulation protein D